MHITVQLLGSGKVTIPARIREELDIDDGDLIELDVQPVGGGGSHE